MLQKRIFAQEPRFERLVPKLVTMAVRVATMRANDLQDRAVTGSLHVTIRQAPLGPRWPFRNRR